IRGRRPAARATHDTESPSASSFAPVPSSSSSASTSGFAGTARRTAIAGSLGGHSTGPSDPPGEAQPGLALSPFAFWSASHAGNGSNNRESVGSNEAGEKRGQGRGQSESYRLLPLLLARRPSPIFCRLFPLAPLLSPPPRDRSA